ncbi:uncharacterized protein DSM5745_00995 [Aspergillus mulundensis]|uniref:RRM domain-containing protein n=1 Tax=Aspergillus mulundensis TaxID=1810919 RepID=A0A3D8T544_9EURO|nr:hypothetical protein DSM5745_00995 [Aspergillus mulundensis]RDW93673.1 hypothetical protein DSM5745_00995 [Aspergillus mulundensis]
MTNGQVYLGELTSPAYIGHLDDHTTAETIDALLAQHGLHPSTTIMTDPDTGDSRLWGFIQFPWHTSEAEKCINLFDHTEIDGSEVNLHMVRGPNPAGGAHSSGYGSATGQGYGGSGRYEDLYPHSGGYFY